MCSWRKSRKLNRSLRDRRGGHLLPFILDTALAKWTKKDQADEMIMRPAVSSSESRISDKCPWYT